MNDDAAFKLILDNSPRLAINQIKQVGKDAQKVLIVSPSPRAERRMPAEDLAMVFAQAGLLLKKMEHLEVHFYAANRVWLPVNGLRRLLASAVKLKSIRLFGPRMEGSIEEIKALGNIFQKHPTLSNVHMCNVEPLPNNPPLYHMLEGIRANPNALSLSIVYIAWVSEYLTMLCDESSRLRSLKLNGKSTIFGVDDEGPNLMMMMEALKTNTRMKELSLCNFFGLPGTGAVVGDMLRENRTLEKFHVELHDFSETRPLSSALQHGRPPLDDLEICIEHEDKTGAQPVITNNVGEIHGGLRGAQESMDGFKNALEADANLKRLAVFKRPTLRQRGPQHITTKKVEFLLTLNKSMGRQVLLKDYAITPEYLYQWMELNSDNPSVIYWILRTRPDLIGLATTSGDVLLSDDDDDDGGDVEDTKEGGAGVEEKKDSGDGDGDNVKRSRFNAADAGKGSGRKRSTKASSRDFTRQRESLPRRAKRARRY